MPNVFWSPEDHDRLRDYVSRGLSLPALLAKFPGRSIASISNQKKRLGLRVPRQLKAPIRRKKRTTDWTLSQDARLRALWNKQVVF